MLFSHISYDNRELFVIKQQEINVCLFLIVKKKKYKIFMIASLKYEANKHNEQVF